MSEAVLVEDFFGVYLLYCLNPKYKGRTYIGYTRDPNRRIMQHNRGTWAGGAFRTSNKGPWYEAFCSSKTTVRFKGSSTQWSMIDQDSWVGVHLSTCYPGAHRNDIHADALFEWAWQNPTKTIRLQHLNLKKIPRKESEYQFKLRILSEMLQVGPWYRLPLVIRWLEEDFYEDFPPERKPPSHISILHGPVKSRNLKKTQQVTGNTNIECLLCSNYIESATSKLTCLNPHCQLLTHINCLANLFLSPGEYVPIEGSCPFCDTKLKWGDLIRKMKGCNDFSIMNNSDNDGYKNDEVSSEDDDPISSQDKGFVDNNSCWLADYNDYL